MDGTRSQLITLASGADTLCPSNMGFKFCNSVRFIDTQQATGSFGNDALTG
jgi:hypothetical protein